jgi:hypothetical protein
LASATRCLGVPCVPASPREQTTKCTLRGLERARDSKLDDLDRCPGLGL